MVARDGAALAGAATAMVSTRHPDVVFAEIVVLPAGRRRGLGRSLLAGLEELWGPAPLLFNVDTTAPGLAGFLGASGYHVVVESLTVRIGVDAAIGLLARNASVLPDGVEITAEAMTEEIEGLYETLYAERHDWAGTYRPTPDRPWISMAGELVPGTLFIARDRQGALAATGVQAGPFAEGADGFIAPTGVVARARSTRLADGVIAALLERTLIAARAAGLRTVNVEHDTPHVELRAALRDVPAEVVTHRQAWLR